MSTIATAPNASDTPGTALYAGGARWVAPGERVVIAGLAIDHGFFYIDDSAHPEPSPFDSCVVSTALDVAIGVAQGGVADPGAQRAASERASEDTDAAQATQAADPPSPASTLTQRLADGPTAAWLNYSAFTPAQRGTWLEWLASDRRASGVHFGYLNLYLYGLERRVLIDGAGGLLDDDEYEAIEAELRRLLKLSGDWAFQTHVENLIESVTVLRIAPDRIYDETPQVRTTRGYQVPFTVRVAFGQAAVDNAPVPAEWAFAWASLDSAITRKPPLGRVPEPFRLMFIKLYHARLRDGMRVPLNRTRLKFPETAFPALRDLDVPESVGVLPDLSAITTPRGRLQYLVNECAAALGAYGRYLTRNPGAEGTLDATLMLSFDLWPEAIRRQLDQLAAATRDRVEVMRFGDLLAAFKTPTGLSREKIVTFVSVLGQSGIGVEPDIRTGARTPRLDDRVALFGIDPATRIMDEDCAYLTAALMIDVAATLAMADGEATHPELTLMHHHIEHAMHLSDAQQQRLKARVAVQLSAPQTLAALKKRLEPLSRDERHVLASFLVQTANADGVVTPEEVRLLEKIYRMLELDTQQLYGDLHQDASVRGRVARKGGVSESSDRATKGAKDIKAAGANDASRAPTSTPITLDAARLSALQDETAQVSALLAQVFAQDAEDDRGAETDVLRVDVATTESKESSELDGTRAAYPHRSVSLAHASAPSSAPSSVFSDANASQPATAHEFVSALAAGPAAKEPELTHTRDASETATSALLGLDDAHSTFLRLLVSRPRWTREELVVAAADLELMLDGAIEQVNEASLDHWDEPLTDGDDPVEINQELAQRLAA